MPGVRPMKILYWTQHFYPYIGGVEVLTANVLPHLERRGYSCSVITSQGSLDLPQEDLYLSTPVYRLPFPKALESGNLQLLSELVERVAALKRQLAPDLIHVFLSDPSFLVHLLTQQAHPSTLVVSIHNLGFDPSTGRHSLLRRLLRTADRVVGVSAFTLRQLHKLVPQCVEDSAVVYSSVVRPRTQPSQLQVDPPVILCVGRMVRDKGFDLALRAVKTLHSRFAGIRLRLIGDGPARAELQALTLDLGLQDHVSFPGWVPPEQMYSIIDQVSLVVVPSRGSETMSQVAVQAAFQERPVVASRIGGLPEVVLDGATGLLVNENDGDELASAVASLLSDPGRARKMGARGRRHAEKNFSMEHYIDTIDQLYRDTAI